MALTIARFRKVPAAWLVVVSGSFIVQFLMMITGILMARMLGVEGRGQVVLIASLAAMASQLSIGGSLANTVTRTLAAHQVKARDGLRRLIPTWTFVGALAGAVAAGFYAYLHRSEPAATTVFLAVAVLVSALNAMAYRIIFAALLGESASPRRLAAAALLPVSATTVLVTGAFLIDRSWSVTGIMLLVLAGQTSALGVSLLLFAPASRNPSDTLDGSEFYAVARRQYFGNLGPLDGLSLDRTLVGSLLGNTALGLYSAAGALALLPAAMGAALAQVMLPLATQRQEHVTEERSFVRASVAVAALIMAAFVAGIEVIAEPAIRYAFGREFLPAVESARWLIPAAGLLGFRRILIAVLQARDRAGRASAVELGLCPVMIVGIVAAALTDDLTYVAVTMLTVGLAACAILGLMVLRSGRIRPDAHTQ